MLNDALCRKIVVFLLHSPQSPGADYVIKFSRFLIALAALWTLTASADTAIHNVTGYTSTADGMREFSVLVFGTDGRIVATGDDGLLAGIPESQRIDGGGRFVLPGLTDAHAHVYSQGFLGVSLNLLGAPSVEAAVWRIADYAAARRSGWILGRGWNQVLWPVKEFPTAADIDAVVVDRDYFAIPASEIDDIRVEQTWVGGELVYEAPAGE